MDINRQKILDNICYTELVYGRVNKKLNLNFTKDQIEEYILNILRDTDITQYSRIGKNYYIVNREDSIRVTVNSSTFRVITVDKIK